jgi:hypothetical protein
MTDNSTEDQARQPGARALRHACRAARLVTQMGGNAVGMVPGSGPARMAAELDFAMANRIHRFRMALLAHERIATLADRLQTQVNTMDALSADIPEGAAAELATQKGHLEWVLGELRRSM